MKTPIVPAERAEDEPERKGSRNALSRLFSLDKIVLLLVLCYFLVPLGATFVFGLSGGKTLDFSSYAQIFSDGDFNQTLLLSLELALAATLLAVILITPTAYWVQLRIPQARPLMDVLTLIPFAVPAIVMSLGLLEVYGSPNPFVDIVSFGLVPLLSNPPFTFVNSPQLLACSYVIIALPFIYRPIDNNLRAINTKILTEAAYSLGSGWWKTFLTVILPNIWPGIISAALLTFSTVMGEFTLASLFGIYTFPIYLNQVGQSDAHKAASLAILSFMLTLICVLIMIVSLRSRSSGQKGEIEIAAAK